MASIADIIAQLRMYQPPEPGPSIENALLQDIERARVAQHTPGMQRIIDAADSIANSLFNPQSGTNALEMAKPYAEEFAPWALYNLTPAGQMLTASRDLMGSKNISDAAMNALNLAASSDFIPDSLIAKLMAGGVVGMAKNKTIKSIDELMDLAKSGAFIRWTSNPKRDLAKGHSVDWSTRSAHEGLSSLELVPDIDDLVRDVMSYSMLGARDKSKPHIFTGTKVGRDTDNADLISGAAHVGPLSKSLQSEMDAAQTIRNASRDLAVHNRLPTDRFEVEKLEAAISTLSKSKLLPREYVESLLAKASRVKGKMP